ncbi:MAG: hypothetical protein AAGF49_11880 [Pseudomonadota bacterium]
MWKRLKAAIAGTAPGRASARLGRRRSARRNRDGLFVDGETDAYVSARQSRRAFLGGHFR